MIILMELYLYILLFISLDFNLKYIFKNKILRNLNS